MSDKRALYWLSNEHGGYYVVADSFEAAIKSWKLLLGAHLEEGGWEDDSTLDELEPYEVKLVAEREELLFLEPTPAEPAPADAAVKGAE